MIVTTTGSIIMVIDDNVIMISIATAIDRVVYAFICIYQLCWTKLNNTIHFFGWLDYH